MEFGTVEKEHMKRTRTVLTEEKKAEIEMHLENSQIANERVTTRQLETLANVSHGTVVKSLHELHYHPYKIQTVQELYPEDFANRMDFCEIMLNLIDEDPDFLQSIWFSDEATFTLHGEVNRHNMRIWSKENPHAFREEPLHSEKIMVWCAISVFGILGPYYFDGNVNNENYLMLLKEFHRDLKSKFPTQSKTAILQQDGAPPHWHKSVRSWLNQNIKWIGRSSPYISWPPRTPDLAPNDFFLWGFLKSLVYHDGKPVPTIAELKRRINTACRKVTTEMLTKTINESFVNRLKKCLEYDGGHVEIEYGKNA
uniref:Transposase n=1 Tax=Panagrolaimus davidi TaxID=227884 RepID=A0A914PRY5_9BILA